MKSEQERIKKLLRDELDKEAEKTIEEVEADASLKNIALPENMDAGLQAKIEQYRANKAAYANLSEEDKEALRLGREQQILRTKDGSDDDNGNGDGGSGSAGSGAKENSEERKVVKFSKRRRMALGLVAIVAVLVMGIGMTSIGGKPFIPQLFEQMLAGRENVNINSSNEENNSVIPAEDDKEEQVYQEIKNQFGFDAVQLWYLPEGTEFLESSINAEAQEAYILFQYNNRIIEYRILVNYRSKSLGYDIEDELLDEFIISSNNVPVDIKHFKIKESGEEQYTAHFKYNNINYVLSGAVEKEIFKQIIENLKFF